MAEHYLFITTRTLGQGELGLALHGLRDEAAADPGAVPRALWTGSRRGPGVSDWTVAIDDGLTQRLTSCTTCGQAPVVYWGLCVAAAKAVAYVLCRACRERDPHLSQVEAFLEARYGGDRGRPPGDAG